MLSKSTLLRATFYYQLIHYQELVEREGVNFFTKIKANRSVKNGEKSQQQLYVHHPPYITFLRLWYNVFVVRGVAILFFPSLFTCTRERRVWIIVEHWRANAANCEGTLFLWSILMSVFFGVTLTHDLTTFKWLALFRMSDRVQTETKSGVLHYSRAGLSSADYRRFRRFRAALKLYYHSIFVSVVPVSAAAMVFLHVKEDIFTSHPVWAYFSSLIICAWIYLCCASHYTLLLSFSLTARYVQIKQDTLRKKAEQALRSLVEVVVTTRTANSTSVPSVSRHHLSVLHHLATFQRRHADYEHLFAELADYNRFWGSYLSTVFLVYSTIVAFALYIVLYGRVTWYLRVAYGTVFFNHALSISAIIAVSGQVAWQQQQWAYRCTTCTAKLVRVARVGVFTSAQVVRLQAICEAVGSLSTASFALSNGTQITHQTFQAIIANIGFYFFLTLQNILYGSSV